MSPEMAGADPVFSQPGTQPAEGLETLLPLVRVQLGLDGNRPWRLISSRQKLRKVFMEIEERHGTGTRRIIGRISTQEKAQRAHDLLRLLWDAGFKPPSRFCVPEPIACLPERALLLLEKARGTQLREKILQGTATNEDAEAAAHWLIALQELRLEGLKPGTMGDPERTRRELFGVLPEYAGRLERIFEVLDRGSASKTLITSHGDYHPMNVYVDAARVTAIDVDTLALREPMYDAAYFLAQSAIMGYLPFDSFAPTEELRSAFVNEYERNAADRFDEQRIAVHMAFPFLRSLHYDFCILRTNPRKLVEPFIAAAERCLQGGRIRLAG